MATLVLLVLLVVLFASVDAWYFVRCFCFGLKAKANRLLKRYYGWMFSVEDLLRPVVMRGMVLPSDIDLHMHMNNSKYLREMDFGRIRFYLESGLRDAGRQLGAATLVAAISIRYRKSLQLWQRFTLTTKVVHWSDDAFYLEQRFTGEDGFIYAIAMVKMVARSEHGRVSTVEFAKLMAAEGADNVESPPPSPELKCWIESLEKSSESLKKELSTSPKKKL